MEWSFTEQAQIISFNSARGSGRSPQLYSPAIQSKRNSPHDDKRGEASNLQTNNHRQEVKISPPVSSRSNQMLTSADVSPPSASSEANGVPRPACSPPSLGGSAAKSSNGRTSQLTIFYDGLVSVYDDIPSEKVQAIMVLIGNRESIDFNARAPMPQVQPAVPRPPPGEHSTAHVFPPAGSSSSGMSNAAPEVKTAEASAPPNNKRFEPEAPGEVTLQGYGDINNHSSEVQSGWRASLALHIGKRRRST
ncbi:hypothetical protein Ancab_006650 [Ancistrocladus abbreviatus]